MELYSESLLKGKSGLRTFVLSITKDGLITDTLILHYTSVDSLAIFQGDIILGNVEDQRQSGDLIDSSKMNFAPTAQYRLEQLITETTVWENKIIPYLFDEEISSDDKPTIVEAMNEWQTKAGVKFVRRSNETSFVKFVSSNGYASQIGRIPGGQTIFIKRDTVKGNVMHEIGHSLGLWHEHCRSDRSKFITIHEENINQNFLCQFIQPISDVSTLNTNYDLNSIMHYPKNAFSSNGNNTIDVLPSYDNNYYNVGNRDSLSQGDINAIKTLYNLPVDKLKNRKPGQNQITCNNNQP